MFLKNSKSLVLKNNYVLTLFVNIEILLECSRNSHWKGRIFRRMRLKFNFTDRDLKKKCHTQIRELMSGPEFSQYVSKINSGLWAVVWVEL